MRNSKLLPVNILEMIPKCFDYSQLWLLRPACSQNEAGFNFPHPIWFLIYSQESLDRVVWNWPGFILVWSGFGQMDLVQKQAGVQELLGPVPAECCWPATSFPLSDSVAFFHRQARSYCAKAAQIQSGSSCVRFGPNGSSPEASQCARIIWPASSQCFWASWSRLNPPWLLGIMHT